MPNSEVRKDGSTTQKQRVLVVDDHVLFADLLIGALERDPDLVGVGCARDLAAGVALAAELRPDIVVLDYHLPDGDGVTAAERILQLEPSTRVILLTGDPQAAALRRAASAGVAAFLAKDGSLASLLDAIRRTTPGNMIVHQGLVSELAEHQGTPPVDSAGLTERELSVLRLMAAGGDVTSNARALGITVNTCRGYVKSILAKLDAHSQLEAVVIARRRRILPDGVA